MLTDNPSTPFILVVEDDDDHVVLIRRSFDSALEPFRLDTAKDLNEARQFLAQHTPDLVLADYRLPDGEGCDLLELVNGACPVIIMTSQSNDQLEEKVKQAGAVDYVVKSGAGFAAMPHLVNLAMRQWASSQEHERAEKTKTGRSKAFDG